LAQQLGRVLVELDAAVVAGARLLAAVERGGGEVAGEAADVDLGGAAALALRGQAGQARDRFGDAGVRQLADVLGRDRLDDRGGGLLGVDGPFDRGTDAGNDDAVELGGLFAVRRRGGVLREGLRCGKQDRGCERGTQQGAPGLQHFPLPKGNVVIGSCGLARRSTRVMTGRRTFAGRAAMVVAAASSGAVLHTYSCALSARENSVLRARRPRACKP